MKSDLLEIITNSYLVNNNIRNAYLLQLNNIKDKKKEIYLKKIIKLYPTLQISDRYSQYQGLIISNHNYNNKVISNRKMGEILEYPCFKDWDKITGNKEYTIYRLSAIINNDIKILLTINKCLNNKNKDKFLKLKTLYKDSLIHKEYSNIIMNEFNIKIKNINVKLETEIISSFDDIIYKAVCNIKLNKSNKNKLLKWGIHKLNYSDEDAMKLINLNELFIRRKIKERVEDLVPNIDKPKIIKLLQNKKEKIQIYRKIGINVILQQIFIL